MTTPALQVYVYYRVRLVDATAAVAAIAVFQDRMRVAVPGLTCALSRRSSDEGEQVTLMETYANPGATTLAWQHDLEREAIRQLGRWVIGARHVEVFVPCA